MTSSDQKRAPLWLHPILIIITLFALSAVSLVAFVLLEPRVRELGFDEHFLRVWEFYLAYCEAAFDEGSTDVMQFTLRKA